MFYISADKGNSATMKKNDYVNYVTPMMETGPKNKTLIFNQEFYKQKF